ncbi:ECs1072 family phage-associated protein [Providencia sp. Je.9.19]|uniref:ECs1072 family phage-associated protein n=1 Tax=Providencia sp. Je.9.19 TaxID=3142844 RepID=UPI003DA9D76A
MRVCRNSKEPDSILERKNNYRTDQLWHRIEQIFILECLLADYRSKNGSLYSPLENEKALHHLILSKTGWALNDIRKLSLNDSMLIIARELRKENIPTDAQTFLNGMKLPVKPYPLDDFPDTDWAPKEDSKLLQTGVYL